MDGFAPPGVTGVPRVQRTVGAAEHVDEVHAEECNRIGIPATRLDATPGISSRNRPARPPRLPPPADAKLLIDSYWPLARVALHVLLLPPEVTVPSTALPLTRPV